MARGQVEGAGRAGAVEGVRNAAVRKGHPPLSPETSGRRINLES